MLNPHIIHTLNNVSHLVNSTTTFWNKLPIAKKIFFFMGMMTFLIVMEFFLLFFVVDTISSVRAFVGGEGLWSKAQKDAVQNLYYYQVTQDPVYYSQFRKLLLVSAGDKKARLELSRENPDMATISSGFLQGRIHPSDIPGMIRLFSRFQNISFLKTAIEIWRQADLQIEELSESGIMLYQTISFGNQPEKSREIYRILEKIHQLNIQITNLEDRFSYVLGEGSRWLEKMLLIFLLLTVGIVVIIAFLMVYFFGRSTTRSLKEMNEAALRVGNGDFSQKIEVHTQDEIGMLADSLNRMSADLGKNIGERILAENSNKLKTQFLAQMSHEIRTPLGAILGFTELLKENHLTEAERRRHLEIIEKTGRSLSQIVDDILDITKVEADHLRIDKVSFSLEKMMTEIYDLMNLKCSEKSISLFTIRSGPVPEKIISDPTRLRQIITNIIGNAIKFTHSGQITVTYQCLNGYIGINITDTGIGVPVSQRDKLFRLFSQGELTRKSDVAGAGLGLALSRRLARLLGGDVVLLKSYHASEMLPGQKTGSTFRIETKYEAELDNIGFQFVKDKNVETVNEAALINRSILLVEDAPDNQLLIGRILEKYGVLLTIACNGEEALQKVNESDFELVIMDMQMPVLDGYRASTILRERNFTKPIIALTAHAMIGDREKCLAAGCSDYMTKPIQRAAFIKIILKHLTGIQNQHENSITERKPQESKLPDTSGQLEFISNETTPQSISATN